jgi:hypothetical protein
MTPHPTRTQNETPQPTGKQNKALLPMGTQSRGSRQIMTREVPT